MNFTPPPVTVVSRKAFTAAGLKVSTNMENAQADCSSIWLDQFVPVIWDIQKKFQATEAFGISVMTDYKTGAFDYWAAFAMPDAQPVPKPLKQLEVLGGLFLEVFIPNKDVFSATYKYIYNKWFSSQTEYTMSNAPCYELYQHDYVKTGECWLYVPVTKA